MEKKISFKGTAVTIEDKLNIGDAFPNFTAVKKDLSDFSLEECKGNIVVINTFPSIDTGICALQTIRFNKEVKNLENVVAVTVSKDLPFALGRFCAAEGIDNLTMLSDFRGDFAKHYPIVFTDTPLKGLLSRCVIVLDEQGKVVYTEQVAETTDEPNYVKALEALK